MNSGYLVNWSETAKKDLRDIVDYVAKDNWAAASMLLSKIEERSSELWSFAEQGRIVPELNDIGIAQCRELIVAPWRLVYRVMGQQVLILAVFDGRRSLEAVLLERFRLIYG
ncbi:MAG: type II toxin-antitoxin system RelE/ParE family toxin [Myxococcaceae bacterium]